MLGFFLLLGFGVLAALIYNAMDGTNAKKDKLRRIQDEIARREALEDVENKEK